MADPSSHKPDLSTHPLVKKLQGDSDTPPSVVALTGYFGPSKKADSIRLYPSLDFQSYFEIPRASIVATTPVDSEDDQSPTVVYVKAGTNVESVQTTTQPVESYLQGGIASAYQPQASAHLLPGMGLATVVCTQACITGHTLCNATCVVEICRRVHHLQTVVCTQECITGHTLCNATCVVEICRHAPHAQAAAQAEAAFFSVAPECTQLCPTRAICRPTFIIPLCHHHLPLEVGPAHAAFTELCPTRVPEFCATRNIQCHPTRACPTAPHLLC